MHKPNALINQIRQPPNISGCQVSNLPLLETGQWGGGPNSVSK